MAKFQPEHYTGQRQSGLVVQDVHTGMVVKADPTLLKHYEWARWINVDDDTPITPVKPKPDPAVEADKDALIAQLQAQLAAAPKAKVDK